MTLWRRQLQLVHRRQRPRSGSAPSKGPTASSCDPIEWRSGGSYLRSTLHRRCVMHWRKRPSSSVPPGSTGRYEGQISAAQFRTRPRWLRGNPGHCRASALCGSVRAGPGPEGIASRGCRRRGRTAEWATVKLRGFADSEEPPPAGQVQQEMSARGRPSRLCVATNWPTWALNQFPCSATTRVGTRWCSSWPLGFRFDAAIAQNLLARWCEQAAAERPWSPLINCDELCGAPHLYRRIGFTDEVYWHCRYQRPDSPRRGVDAQRLQPGVRVDPRCRSSIVGAAALASGVWCDLGRPPVPRAWTPFRPRRRCRADRRIRAPSCSPTMRAPSGLQSVPTNHRGPWLWRARAAEVRGGAQGGVGVTACACRSCRTRRSESRVRHPAAHVVMLDGGDNRH